MTDPELNDEAERRGIAQRLRRVCDESGLSQREVARRVGCNPAAVTKWFGGQMPTALLLAKLCKITGASADWILHGEGPFMLDDEAFEALTKSRANIEDMESAASSLVVRVGPKLRLGNLNDATDRVFTGQAIVEKARGKSHGAEQT